MLRSNCVNSEVTGNHIPRKYNGDAGKSLSMPYISMGSSSTSTPRCAVSDHLQKDNHSVAKPMCIKKDNVSQNNQVSEHQKQIVSDSSRQPHRNKNFNKLPCPDMKGLKSSEWLMPVSSQALRNSKRYANEGQYSYNVSPVVPPHPKKPFNPGESLPSSQTSPLAGSPFIPSKSSDIGHSSRPEGDHSLPSSSKKQLDNSKKHVNYGQPFQLEDDKVLPPLCFRRKGPDSDKIQNNSNFQPSFKFQSRNPVASHAQNKNSAGNDKFSKIQDQDSLVTKPGSSFINIEGSSSESRSKPKQDSSSCLSSSSSGGGELIDGHMSLMDESKNLSIDMTEKTDSSSPSPKRRSPYSVYNSEKLSQLKCVKIGDPNETSRIRVIKQIGDNHLWGWVFERKSLTPPSKQKNNVVANGITVGCKRKLDYDTSSSSKPPSPKRVAKESDKYIVKENNLDGRDPNSNKNNSSKAPMKAKETKTFSSHKQPKPSCSSVKTNPTSLDKTFSKSSETSSTSSAEMQLPPNAAMNSKKLNKPPEKIISLPLNPVEVADPRNGANVIDNENMGFIASKKERSAVYSGKKIVQGFPTLKCLVSIFVRKILHEIKVPDYVPFATLLPILQTCSPAKLHKIEEMNPHLSKDTNPLWEQYCKTNFKGEQPINGEPWKDVYWRAHSRRQDKLKSLTASISNGKAKTIPERQVKCVGVDTIDPEKRQRKNKVVEVTRKVEEVSKPEINGRGGFSVSKPSTSGTVYKSSGSDYSSSSPPDSQPAQKTNKSSTKKKPLPPLMMKTKKMLNQVKKNFKS